MPAVANKPVDRPFVETSIARQMMSRLQLTHEECGISVIAGPWGIGKTTALDAFEAAHPFSCAIVKVDPGSSKKGATPTTAMLLALEAMQPKIGKNNKFNLNNAYWSLRLAMHRTMRDWQRECLCPGDEEFSKFTFIFDEAQYLSREAIEMLRFWNDDDRATTPFPVGLVFVGNNEFALQEDYAGQSVLSGAVRSRALFIESLEYTDVSDLDLTLFLQSRAVTDPAAIATVIRYFSKKGVRRDLRSAERFVSMFHRRAGEGHVTEDVVRRVLSPD